VTKEEIMKAVEEVVTQTLAAEKESKEEVVASAPEAIEKAEDKKESKKHEKKESKEEEKEEDKKKALKKAEDCDDEDDKDDKKESKKDDKKESKDKKKKPAFFKKSESEEAEEIFELDEDEVELIKAWRAQSEVESTEEGVTKSEEPKEEIKQEDTLGKAQKEENDQLKKSLSEQADLIKGLTEKFEKLASQPAYEKRSISSLEPIEKSESATQDVSKQQVLEKMLELQIAGKGVRSTHIAEFESTNNISDLQIRNLVMNSVKTN